MLRSRRSNPRNVSRRWRNASPPCFRLRPDFIAHSILLTLRKYELLYLDVRSISLAHAVVSLFYLRIKKQSPGERGVWILFITLAGTWYTPYIAFIKFRFVASTVLLLLRANNEHFENNLIDRLPVRPPFQPSTFSSKTLAEIILRRCRFCPYTLVIFHLSVNSFLLRLAIDAKQTTWTLRSSSFFALLRFPSSAFRSASREVTAGVEKLSPRFHPNVTDLTSRGDAARFPRIIILLSYNSFNSRESKTRESNAGLPRIHTDRPASVRVMF